MDKNRKFTVTWNELESLVNGLVTEQLHKYGLLNESMSSSEDDVEDDNDNEFNYGELQQLIDLYEAGELNSDDEGEDYGLQMYIRHYNRGEIDFSINDLFDTLKKLNFDRLIKLWDEGDIWSDDEDEEKMINDWVNSYKRGDEAFDSEKLYRWLND